MNSKLKSFLRRTTIALISLIVLTVLFYTEEDLRGWHAWQNCKREFEAKGFVLDWDKLIPPPVPDDQNFFNAPKMQEWFVENWHSKTNELADKLHDKKFEAVTASVSTATNLVKTADEAKNYLAWSDQFEPDFNLIREALKQPYAQMDGDYANPFGKPMPDFITERAIAQMSAQRVHCYLLLGQPEQAFGELKLLNDSRRLLEAAPTGKPMTLVAAMINIAVTGLYADTIADGLRSHSWREPQLIAIQQQLQKINLPPFVAKSFELEAADMCWVCQLSFKRFPNDPTFWQNLKRLRFPWGKWMPSGWVYQNMITGAKVAGQEIDSIDLANNLILPQKVDKTRRAIEEINNHFSPYTFIAAVGIFDTTKAFQNLGRNQSLVNEVQIVCALERYRQANGSYPGSLDALVPRYIETLPHDIIGGQPLIYHPRADGKFLLYSIGWNETDDGGQESTAKTSGGGTDFTKGDWVWKN